MTLTKRQWILGTLLTATLAAVAWVAGDEPASTAISKPSLRSTRRAADTSGQDAATPRTGTATDSGINTASTGTSTSGSQSGEVIEPQRLVRLVTIREVGNPFQGASPPAPVPPPKPAITVAPQLPVAPPAPTAPPFPWTFMGRLIDDPKDPVMFLSKGDRLTMAHIGDTLSGGWKVGGMDARGMRVEYLPLKQSQTVALASGSEVNASSASTAATSSDNAGGGQSWSPPQPAAANAPQLLQQLQQQGVQNQDPAAQAPPPARSEPATPPAQPSAVSGIDVSSGVGGVTLH